MKPQRDRLLRTENRFGNKVLLRGIVQLLVSGILLEKMIILLLVAK